MTTAGDVYASNRGLQWSVRVFGGCMLAALPIYFFNNYLSFVLGWPGIEPIFASGEVTYQSWIQLALFVAVVVFAVVLVQTTTQRHLRDDAAIITRVNTCPGGLLGRFFGRYCGYDLILSPARRTAALSCRRPA